MNGKIERVGNFTSSEIVKLLSMGSREMTDEEKAEHKKAFPKSQKKTIECWPGQAALTYIEECNMERRLGRSLCDDIDTRPTIWGKLVEGYGFDLLDISYTLCSDITLSHPTIKSWKGSPDARKIDTVADLKCPKTLKSFCQLVDAYKVDGKIIHEALTIEAVRANHKEGETYYWQIVSNAVLTGAKYGELIVFVPYKSELESIRKLAKQSGDNTQWISFAGDNELPFLIDGGYYKNLNIIRFEIPQSDKDLLTSRVLMGEKLLDSYQNFISNKAA